MPGVIIPAPEGGLVVVHGRDADGNYVPLRCTPTGYLVVADFAPTGAQYVVLALHADLDNESLHSALTGADLHDPKAHAASHEAGGGDAVSLNVDDLVDVNAPTPADDEVLAWDAATAKWIAQVLAVAAHALGGAEHTADTLANLNAKVSDATLDDSSAARTPTAHNTTHAGGGTDKLKYTRQILFFDPTDPIATGTDTLATIVYRGPTLTLVRWDMRCKTAPVGAAMIFDVNVGGTSLWATNQANRPTIADGATSGTGTAFDTTTLSDGDVLTIDYDQVGSTTAGGQVTLILEGDCNLQTD